MFRFDIEPDYDCFHCSQKSNQIDDIKYWLSYLLEQLYSKEKLDLEEVERTLEELCGYAELKIPISDLNISRKENISNEISEWKKLNINFLKSITN